MGTMQPLVLFAGCVAVSAACWPGSGSGSDPSVSTNEMIARKAEDEEKSQKWDFVSAYRYGLNTDKSNVFVAEIIQNAGGTIPQRYVFMWSPISAEEWAKPQSSVLKSSSFWTNVESAERGDVAACGHHVGIVVGFNETVSAMTAEQKIVRNNWGFMSSQNTTFWRYIDS